MSKFFPSYALDRLPKKKFYQQPMIETMDVEEEESILIAASQEEPGYGGEIPGQGPQE